MKSWIKLLKDKYILLFCGLAGLFFYQFFLFGKIPIPADTIVGMYHPWRDNVWDGFTAGVPFKNPLITDPVRQQYVWRMLAIEQLAQGQLPLWNSYSFSGTPLLANFQSAAFYPLNVLFFLMPFPTAWGTLVFLQPVLAGVFLYLYLRHFRISKIAAFIGAIAFSYGGFAVAWMEWNTISHTVLWLPLILLAKEKILFRFTYKWVLILVFAEIFSITAGHLQFLFYAMVVSNVYLLMRIIQLSVKEKKNKVIFAIFQRYTPFIIAGVFVFLVTAIQWIPTLQFIEQSAREFDQGSWLKDGWFIPWQNLIQFLAPDFFGNPATGNYWGVWNYGEFVGYLGILPLIFALYAIFFRRDKKTIFFSTLFIFALIFALPTPLARIIYQLNIPYFSTSQPTRLLFIISLSLCILAALGADLWLREKNIKKTAFSVTLPVIGLLIAWSFVLIPKLFSNSVSPENVLIAQKNLVLPSIVWVVSTSLIVIRTQFKMNKTNVLILHFFIVSVVIFDLFRFGWKFIPFSKKEWLYPPTRTTQILLNEYSIEPVRFLTLDRRIMAPNFSVGYHLQDVSGYDPLYLKRYGQFVAAWERDKPDISPAAFNRIITPVNFESSLADFLGIKYVLSLRSIRSDKLRFISQEGDTYVYENMNKFPRAFLVEKVFRVLDDQDEIDKMFSIKDQLKIKAVSQSDLNISDLPLSSTEAVSMTKYTENIIKLKVKAITERLLVLTDPYYPTWAAYIDGRKTPIYRVDFLFRGVLVPKGEHTVLFTNSLFQN